MKKLFTSSGTLWSCLIALVMMMVSQSAMAEYVKLTALRGTGGEGRAEGYQALVDTYDGRNGRNGTKWGQGTNFGSGGEAWVIVKAEKAFTPQNYYLVTANDTNGSQGRQWTGWNIYGANFESDDAAQKDAEWELIDQREEADVSMQNFGVTQFTLNDAETLAEYDGTPYQYYMIEVTGMVTDGQYLQMGEFGFGTYADFQTWLEIQAADPTKPVSYTALAGSPAGFGGEGFGNLFDNKSSSKWCTWIVNREKGTTENGAYVIFKTGRPMAASYYSLTTANDSKNSNRNWKQWQLYGMNASSDAAVTRDAEDWVLLDERENIGADELPNENYAQAFFLLSGEATSYKYYKLELDRVWGGDIGDDALMQMSELAIGDEYTLALDRKAVLESITYDPDLFAEKALLDQLAEVMESIKTAEDPKTLGNLNTQASELQNKVNESVKQYAELTTARNMAANQLADDDVADIVLAYVTAWASETDAIAPGAEYPVGNFAYIVANRQLTGEEAAAEAKRFSTLLLQNTKQIPDPIASVGYEFICGTTDNWADGESPAQLIDGLSGINGTESTKWGTGTGGDRWLVFRANEPIKPSYYGLVTGGDTGVYTDRNWKNWKIWAANFDEELDPEAEGFNPDAIKKSDKWVLIDVKENVGTDVLKTTSLFESYINLSIGCTEPYKYFKIEVYHSGGMQMNEFTFYNMGDLAEYREGFVAEFEDYDPLEYPAYKGYTDAYAEKYEELKTTVNAPDVMKIKNELVDLQEQITSSVERYDEYQAIYDELVTAGAASESLQAWFDGYTGENIAPNNIYRRGTYEYIMENLNLDNDALGKRDGGANDPSSGEIGYLENMINAATDGVYVLVEGHTDSQWGDGYYGHLIDGIALNEEGVDDDGKPITINATKWGGNANADGDTYVIFRTLDKTNPFFYTLTTGNDTGRFPNRNWGTWYIYGGNFEGDVDATKDAEGWVLIDAKENIGQDRLHPVNAQPSYFGFSTETTEEYTYYKVVVTKAFSGSQIQMNELHFGTAEEFEEIKDEYQNAAREFDYDIADQTLIDKYKANIDAIDDCQNMEALFRANYILETLRDSIKASEAVYNRYAEAVETIIQYLEENNLADSEAKTILVNYLQGDAAEPSELYPNGSALYITEEHLLADSVVLKEIEFMESLKLAAVAAGYGKGMDITSLIVNPTFKNASETIKDEEGKNLGRVAEGWDGYIYRTATDSIGKVYAAEFCNELAKFDISQTLTDMKNGFYKVTLNAGYRANGDLLSYNHAPMAYANDVKTIIPVVREYAVKDSLESWQGATADHKIVEGQDEDGNDNVVGWGMWGCEGAANSFTQGRYAITMVAQVTDGKLTIGVKNEGTQGNEWTAAGNFGLVYLGETEDDAAAALKEAADYNAARITTLTEVYTPDISETTYSKEPGFAASQKAALAENSGVATYAAEKAIGETMQAIYETKKAYASLYLIATKVYDKWINTPVGLDMDDEFEDIKANLEEGNYDVATANAVGAEYVAKYPDYLTVAAYNSAVDVVPDDSEAFYDLAASYGRNPSVLMGGSEPGAGFYDELTKDEVIFAFEYSASTDLPASRFYIGKDADDTQAMDIAIPASAELTQVYINLTQAVKKWGFGKTDDAIRWRFAVGESDADVAIRHARMITKAQMKAEGGTALNKEKGDVNGDDDVNGMDVIAIYNVMLGNAEKTAAGDVNGDGDVNGMDVIAVYNIMLGNE